MVDIVNAQCRTCLTRSAEVISLCAHHVVCNKVMSMLDLLKTCTSVQIAIDDGYPQHICVYCIRLAETSYEFRLKCERADKSLRNQMLELNQSSEQNANTETDHLIDNKEDLIGTVVEQVVAENDREERYDEKEYTIKMEEVLLEEPDAEDTFACNVCNLNFPTQIGLARHSALHVPNYYQCPHCPVRFISQELLDKHVIKHIHYKKEVTSVSTRRGRRKRLADYRCLLCSKRFISQASLRIHLRKHEAEENIEYLETTEFHCNFCPKKYDNISAFEKHVNSHKRKIERKPSSEPEEKNIIKSKSIYNCKYCSEVFNNVPDLQKHLEKHIDAKGKKSEKVMENKIMYKCKICAIDVGTLAEMKDHLSKHNVDNKSIFQNLLYKCSECQTDFVTIYDYFGHMSLHTSGTVENCPEGGVRIVRKRPYKCTAADCEKAFPTPSALKSHARSHQSRWPKKCRYCDIMMNKWHDYMTHLNQEHDDMKTFICQQCGKKFFKERNLESHAKTHSGERNYMCDICGFSFHAQNNLVSHRRLHTGVKPYKCNFCPKAFSQHAGLRSHLINHVGERKHECPTCNRKFLRVGSLKNHIKTHTGVKDYACHICGARFGASSTRKKHLLIHTGERNHICDFCGKAFSRRSNLSVHRKIHTGETSHVCEICGKGFIQAHVLRTHMNTHRKRAAIEALNATMMKDEEIHVEDSDVLIELAE